ncbi:hypothetical protein [Micrococcus luteus]|uniref:hypothetical protein n=1 Tax=Micrococcus luteus TaxID=1270 RepID=UPI0012DC6961|nr:hypothetical protein [Micrococcus luteus]MCJ2193851.1 hypothetical protein [Kaistella montana]MCV7527983.1 hypothetical protein [Micrococcus luteus]QGS22064.1 hypothetical protein FOB85_07845 [Micrococcus luteus]
MRPQQTRVSPLGRRRPISPLGPALLAAAAGVVLTGVRRIKARSARRRTTGRPRR